MPAGIRTSLTRVYTYPAYLTYSSYAALPAAVREEADQMQSLWNAMVDVYEVAHRQQERLGARFVPHEREPSGLTNATKAGRGKGRATRGRPALAVSAWTARGA